MAKLNIAFQTTTSLSNRQYAEQFYDIFDKWRWPPTRFDKYEPIRRPWKLKEEFIKAWLEEGREYFGQVLVQRTGEFSYSTGPIMAFGPKTTCHMVDVYDIPESQCTVSNLPDVVRLADELFIGLDLDYGRICLSDDYDAKNVVLNYRDSRGRLEPRHIIGVKEWPACLPGIYWTNYFGRKYLEQDFGKGVGDCSGLQAIMLPGGGMRVQLSDRPGYFRDVGGRLIEETAMNALGREWFFERNIAKDCTPLKLSFEHFKEPPALNLNSP